MSSVQFSQSDELTPLWAWYSSAHTRPILNPGPVFDVGSGQQWTNTTQEQMQLGYESTRVAAWFDLAVLIHLTMVSPRMSSDPDKLSGSELMRVIPPVSPRLMT